MGAVWDSPTVTAMRRAALADFLGAKGMVVIRAGATKGKQSYKLPRVMVRNRKSHEIEVGRYKELTPC